MRTRPLLRRSVLCSSVHRGPADQNLRREPPNTRARDSDFIERTASRADAERVGRRVGRAQPRSLLTIVDLATVGADEVCRFTAGDAPWSRLGRCVDAFARRSPVESALCRGWRTAAPAIDLTIAGAGEGCRFTAGDAPPSALARHSAIESAPSRKAADGRARRRRGPDSAPSPCP